MQMAMRLGLSEQRRARRKENTMPMPMQMRSSCPYFCPPPHRDGASDFEQFKEREERSTRSILREISILKPEIALLPLTPRALPIKVDVHALLVLLSDRLRLRVALEPGEVLHVESPRLTLELFGGEVPSVRGATRHISIIVK